MTNTENGNLGTGNGMAKIAVDTDVDEKLNEALKVVNAEFLGGRVTKGDLASWFISQGVRDLDTQMVHEIHQAHFNQVVYLDNLVKQLKSRKQEALGEVELAALQTLFKQTESIKRKPKRDAVSTSDEKSA